MNKLPQLQHFPEHLQKYIKENKTLPGPGNDYPFYSERLFNCKNCISFTDSCTLFQVEVNGDSGLCVEFQFDSSRKVYEKV